MRWQVRTALTALAIIFGSFLLDQVVWTVRGSPLRQIEIKVVTTMELKNHKEDYGPAETRLVTCEAALLPFPGTGGWSEPCWWLERHREMIQRY